MLNFSSWKKFKITDLFNISRGKTLTLEDKEEFQGSIPCINGSSENNGYLCSLSNEMISKKHWKLFKAPALSLVRVGEGGRTFVQDKDFFVADNAFCLELKFKEYLSENILLFLSTILNCDTYRYSYGRTVTDAYVNGYINLPTTSTGTPDWNYMDNYIKSLSIKLPETKNSSSNEKIDTDQWMFFRIGELFKLEIGKNKSQENLPSGKGYYYLGAKKLNNGVMLECGYDENLMSKGNCIVFICNGQGSVGYTNYMDREFIATADLVMGYNKNLNPYIGMFLVTILDKERPKYSFGRKWKTHLADTQIKLPATPIGEPDWQYMEDYIKSLPYGDCI